MWILMMCPCPKAPSGVPQRSAPEGDARVVWSSQNCDVCCCVCPNRHPNCFKKTLFWTALDRVVKEVPGYEQLFVLMDANARTGRRGGGGSGSEDCRALGAYGRDTLNDNDNRQLVFATSHGLTLVNTFFSTPKNRVSHTFNTNSCWCPGTSFTTLSKAVQKECFFEAI